MAKKRKQPKSLWDKVHDFDENFAVAVNTMTDDALKQVLVEMANNDDRIEKARENDDDLKSKKEEAKVAGETYSIPLKQNRLRRKLALDILVGRGKLPTD
jgi:hypothetical protein